MAAAFAVCRSPGFSDDGIQVDSSGNTITCNYLGVAANGITAAGNRWGV